MGTQQLLIIVVGVIVVGLMIFAGISITQTYMETSNRDHLITTLYDLGLMAQQHYKKLKVQGGGEGTYDNWLLPPQYVHTESGNFAASVNSDRVDLSATGTQIGRNQKTPVRVTARVDVNGVRITIVN